MGDVAARHRQDRDLRDRAGPVPDATAALVDGGQVAVEVARVAAPRRHLAAGGSDLAQRLAVVGHVDEDDQHVEPKIEGEMLGDRQGESRREQPLHDRVCGRIDDEDEFARGLPLLEPGSNRSHVGLRDPHRPENDPERSITHVCLGRDLDGELEVGQPAYGEDRQLLTPHDRGQRIHDRDAGDDRVAGRLAAGRVDREAGHLALDAREHRRPAVDGIAAPVALPTEPGVRDRDRQRPPDEADPAGSRFEPGGPLHDLDDGQVMVDLEDDTVAHLARGQVDLRVFVPAHAVRLLDDDEWTPDRGDR
jgi:hypothetical protein